MIRIVRGIVHGKTIQLDTETGLEDGRKVEVILRAKELPAPPPGWKPDNSQSAAGMMASLWTEEDERILEDIHQQRKRDSRREIPE